MSTEHPMELAEPKLQRETEVLESTASTCLFQGGAPERERDTLANQEDQECSPPARQLR